MGARPSRGVRRGARPASHKPVRQQSNAVKNNGPEVLTHSKDIVLTAFQLPIVYTSLTAVASISVWRMPPVREPAGEHIITMEARVESRAALFKVHQHKAQSTDPPVWRLDLVL